MLNDRERRALEGIEQQLAAGDPEFVQIFRSPTGPPLRDVVARVLMALGLALVLFGSATVDLAVAALGTAVTLGSLLMMSRGRDASGADPAT